MKYNYLIVGSGLFGATFAREAMARGKSCLILEKRGHVGGNVYCDDRDGIRIHVYGAHIFHTSNERIWDYVRQFAKFNHYINSPIANYKGEIYNLPFNMNTFSKMWGITTPKEVKEKIDQQRNTIATVPRNLEEQAISLVGRDIYEKLIRGYTEKQWGRACSTLPAFIIKRLPVRYTYDNNYFNDPYQGIPIGGYTGIIEKMIDGCDIKLNTDFNQDRKQFDGLADRIIYTGPIDAFYDYCFGKLAYRSLRFEIEKMDTENFQGVAVMNYTDRETPYTRIIEHKHFEFGKQPVTYISKEYPMEWKERCEPYYPINNDANQRLYERYNELAQTEKRILFGGRLAEYKYYDMDQTIASALKLVKKEFDV